MERINPAIGKCQFGTLCIASGIALLVFLVVLLLVG